MAYLESCSSVNVDNIAKVCGVAKASIESVSGVLMAVPVLIDSYSETNQNSNIVGGQAIALASDCTITSVKFYCCRLAGTHTGVNAFARIFACTGTPGSTGKPTGGVLAQSDNIPLDDLAISPAWALAEFTFSTPYSASAGNYCLVLWTSGSDRAYAGDDTTSPTHAGNTCFFFDGVWYASSTSDTCFYLYGYT